MNARLLHVRPIQALRQRVAGGVAGCVAGGVWTGVAVVLGLLVALGSGPVLAQVPPGATLPLRNLSVELRQVSERQTQSGEVAVAVEGNPRGGQVVLRTQPSGSSQQDALAQQVLVLNGREASFNIGQSQPVQLLWLGIQGAVVGTVWLEQQSGLVVQPRWLGGNQVELRLSVQQATRDERSGAPNALPATRTATTRTELLVPLNEWVTIAEAQTAQVSSGEQARTGLTVGGVPAGQRPGSVTRGTATLGSGSTTQQSQRYVQVRVSVP